MVRYRCETSAVTGSCHWGALQATRAEGIMTGGAGAAATIAILVMQLFSVATPLEPACGIGGPDGLPSLPQGTIQQQYGSVSECGTDNAFNGGTIVIGGPLSMEPGDGFFTYGTTIRRTLTLFADWVNRERVPRGIQVGNLSYAVRFVFVEDKSSSTQVLDATDRAIQGADFVWGPYSSGLSKKATTRAYAAGKLFFANTAASRSVYTINNLTFGTLPPADAYLIQPLGAIKHAAQQLDANASQTTACGNTTAGVTCVGSLKIGFIQASASFTQSICAPRATLAADAGISVTSLPIITVPKTPTNLTELAAELEKFRADGINVLVGCTYEPTARAIIQVLELIDYSPFALVVTSAVTGPNYGSDVHQHGWWQGEYAIGPAPWHQVGGHLC